MVFFDSLNIFRNFVLYRFYLRFKPTYYFCSMCRWVFSSTNERDLKSACARAARVSTLGVASTRRNRLNANWLRSCNPFSINRLKSVAAYSFSFTSTICTNRRPPMDNRTSPVSVRVWSICANTSGGQVHPRVWRTKNSTACCDDISDQQS